MNVHHLELFYYVARHGGISEAVRNIPYGIQQPAVSGQIAQLEESLGTVLFHRRPFELTPPGEKLFRFIQPFFGGLEAVSMELKGGREHLVRIGSSDIVLRDHLPELWQAVRKRYPQLKLALREGYQPELEALLESQEIDLAVTLIEKKPMSGIRSMPLLDLPMVLLVPKDSQIQSARELWQRDKIEESLICLPGSESLCRNFQQGLARLGVEWFARVEVTSLDLVEVYVTNGFGVGLSVSIPGTRLSAKVRALPLDGFKPVTVGALWRGKLPPLVQAIIKELQARVERMVKGAIDAP